MQQISHLGSYTYRNFSAGNKPVVPVYSANSQKSAPVLNNKKLGNITKLKKSTAMGAAFALATTFAMLLKESVKIYKKSMLNDIPKDLQTQFAKLDDLHGIKFVDTAYEELVKYMGLEGIAPKKITFTKAKRAFQIEGGYIPAHNKIEFSNNFLFTLSKAEQINLIAHELRHCKQFTDMLRTEGIDTEKFAQAITELNINATKRNNPSFRHNHYRAKNQNKEKEFLNNARKDTYNEVRPLIEKNFAHVLQLPKYKKNSLESREALRNIETIYSYNGINSLGLIQEDYKEQLIEIDAYKFGERMKNLFKKYQRAMS